MNNFINDLEHVNILFKLKEKYLPIPQIQNNVHLMEKSNSKLHQSLALPVLTRVTKAKMYTIISFSKQNLHSTYY